MICHWIGVECCTGRRKIFNSHRPHGGIYTMLPVSRTMEYHGSSHIWWMARSATPFRWWAFVPQYCIFSLCSLIWVTNLLALKAPLLVRYICQGNYSIIKSKFFKFLFRPDGFYGREPELELNMNIATSMIHKNTSSYVLIRHCLSKRIKGAPLQPRLKMILRDCCAWAKAIYF